MAPCFKSVNHDGKFKIVGGVVRLMLSKLSRGVGYNLSFLHQDTTEPKLGSVTIHDKVLGYIWHGQYWGSGQSLLQLLETAFAFLGPFKLLILQ